MNEELRVIITAEIEDLQRQVQAAQREIQGLANKGNTGLEKFANGAKAAGKAVGNAMKIAAGAIAAAAGAIIGIGAATKEYQVGQAKLITAFEAAGSSAEAAKETYNDLYRVLGDDGKAVEAANHIAQMTTNQKELEQWTKITQGVYATFGESLPIESLTEAANETAKTGELTGALSDALLWAGIAEDDFKASLMMCNDEAEREALIRETLSGIYDQAAEGYEKNAAAILAENEAQAKLTEAMATLGEVALPIMTVLKTLTAEFLGQLTPFVSMIGEGLSAAMEGSAGAGKLFADGLSGILDTIINLINDGLPKVIQLIVDLVPALIKTILSALPSIIDTLVEATVQITEALAEMLPGIVDAIMEVLPVLIVKLLESIPTVTEAAIKLLMSIVDAIPTIITALLKALPQIIQTLIRVITTNSGQIMSASVQLLFGIIKAIPKIIPEIVKAIPKIIVAIVKGLAAGIKDVTNIGKDLIKGLWNGIKDMTSWIKDKIKGFGKSVVDGLKNFFGIKSPSKLMESVVGKNLALGIGEGFVDNMAAVNKDITKSIAPLTNMSITGSIKGPSKLQTWSSGLINTGNNSIDSLVKAINGSNKQIVLQVDKRVLGRITAEGINDITKLTGSIPLVFA